MIIIPTIAALRAWRKQQGRIAFVPTMGNLHEGHLQLVEEAKAHADAVVVSIFVNPLQFGQGEDFSAYPRTLEMDAQKLIAHGVDAVFTPDEKELYPHGKQVFQVEPSSIQNELCGAHRPGHFRGVATVVSKLFNIVQPDVACFGKKDYQQLYVIQRMVEELNFPIKIVPVDTGRDGNGLALSSRNGYLTAEELQKAPLLYQLLLKIKVGIEAENRNAGKQNYAALEKEALAVLAENGWQAEYVAVRNMHTLEAAQAGDKDLVVLAAAMLGKTRLIDNVEIHLT